jgi:AraC family transcriptional activator FtrA
MAGSCGVRLVPASDANVADRYDRVMSSPHRVACVAFDGVVAFELGIVADLFGPPRPEAAVDWWYAFALCAVAPGPVRVAGGFDVIAAHGLEAVERADTVVVCGFAVEHVEPPPALVAAIVAAHTRGTRIVSICTGAFLLAAAGLLDGREATTHWRWADRLQARFPRVRVNPSVLYVDGGDVLTAAGKAAGIDLCLHIIRSDHGADVANRVARGMVVSAHRDGGQAQFIELPVAPTPLDDPIGRAMDFARGRLAQRVSVRDLARHAHLSPRQFERRFQSATGLAPGRWLTRTRIESSLALLESDARPVEDVAAAVGLSPAGFRRHFRAHLEISPSAYRRQFRGTAHFTPARNAST